VARRRPRAARAWRLERLAGLARLDADAARPRAGIEGVAAESTPGIGSGGGHGTSRGASPASSASRFAVERLPGLIAAPRATAPQVSRASRPNAPCGKQRRGASLFPGIPASYDLLGFFDGCEAPAQLDNILPHGIFNDFLFFNPQDQRLRRWTVEFRNVKIYEACSRPVLLEDTIDIIERTRFAFFFAKSKNHVATPTMTPMMATTLQQNSMLRSELPNRGPRFGQMVPGIRARSQGNFAIRQPTAASSSLPTTSAPRYSRWPRSCTESPG
jgi:hypothetical protein